MRQVQRVLLPSQLGHRRHHKVPVPPPGVGDLEVRHRDAGAVVRHNVEVHGAGAEALALGGGWG